jgi:uncharacterized protein
MNILIDINHPAHVHYFKCFIREMQKKGHKILITASKKEITYQLLEKYQFDFIRLGAHGNSMIKKIINLPIMIFHMCLAGRKFKPEIILGVGSIRGAYTSAIFRIPCVSIEDTEHSIGQIRLYRPFAQCICTPTCFLRDLGSKQVRFDGYLELAHLHPNRFIPNPAVLHEIGLKETDTFIIVRFISWAASHDIGHHGIRDKIGFVKSLEKYGKVIITSEGDLPEELKPYIMKISPEKVHDLLYYATLYVGEGGTMASEAAVLGTHALHISTTAKFCGSFCDINRYGLLWTSEDDEDTIKKAIELLRTPDLRKNGKTKRDRLIKEKIDVTAFMMWLIEKYPESVKIMKENPDYQNIFQSQRST